MLEMLALGEYHEMTHAKGHTRIIAHGKARRFDIFIDARGRKRMLSADLRFPELRHALVAAGFETPEISHDCSLHGLRDWEGRVRLATLPVLMQDQPFVQGITASAEIGRVIAQAERRAAGQIARAKAAFRAS